jgi:CMP-N,N'-diacetyllegionaminic acid synthase
MGDVVAVIHARGGSVRVPLKNLRLLGGRPLITWCIKAALESCCDRVIVSTDHDEIARVAREAGADVPFKRPPDISKDVASELVTQHAIQFHEEQTGHEIEIAVTIQPTTPFLSAQDINAAITLIRSDQNIDSVFTAGPIHQRPEWMFHCDAKGHGKKFIEGVIQGDYGVSQSLPELWHPNGGGYITPRKVLFDDGLIIGNRPGLHRMSDLSSIDIDEEIDFFIAEAAIKFLTSNEN